MDRRLADTTDPIRFRVHAARCDGQGVCALIAPELFTLDRYGLAYTAPGSTELVAKDHDVRARGLEADALCPRNAIFEELVASRPAPGGTPPALTPEEYPRRLIVDGQADSLAAGAWQRRTPDELIELVERAALRGQGGASFPVAAKWRRSRGSAQPVIIANGSEREPGTIKDRYLLGRRPFLILEGLYHAIAAIGATLAVVAVDDDAEEERTRFTEALAEAVSAGLFDGVEVRVQAVPARYVAGEETALISVIEGGKPVPRVRPPFPSDVGLFGRSTLIQNIETLAQVALVVRHGADELRARPTGLFSVGRFGGGYEVLERPIGYPLRRLLADTGLLDGARAVVVGGYAGGIIAAGQLDIRLTSEDLALAGASLGTKSVHVIGNDRCPIQVVADIVGYFGDETAEQCPPCFRGLPDMARLLRDIDEGKDAARARADLDQFMSTLADRGICRLPDGAARMCLSLLRNFADDIDRHLAHGCDQP